MTMTPVKETHVYLDEKGDAWVKRAGVSVKQIVTSLKQLDFSPENVVKEYPYLRLSEVAAALAYYYDHRQEIDEKLRLDAEFAAKLRTEIGEAPVTARLRALGKLP